MVIYNKQHNKNVVCKKVVCKKKKTFSGASKKLNIRLKDFLGFKPRKRTLF